MPEHALLKACKKDQAEVLRTWSGKKVYHAAVSRRALCSSNVRALGNWPFMAENGPLTTLRARLISSMEWGASNCTQSTPASFS